MKNEIVIFDFDGTLTVTDTLKFQLFLLLLGRPWKAFEIASLANQFKHKKIDISQLKEHAFRNLLKGRSVKAVTINMLPFAAIFLLIRRKSLWLLFQSFKMKNVTIVIATASPAVFVQNLLKRYNPLVIGIEFRIMNGIYTGDFDKAIPYGEEKATQLKELKLASGESKIIAAYSDDTVDIPILNLAQEKYLISEDGTVSEFIN